MRRIIISLLLLAGLTLAAGLNVQAAPEPADTQELLWDADQDGSELHNTPRAVWFVMPFDGTVITARTDLVDSFDVNYDISFCPRGGDGLPDESATYGTLNHPGGASAPGWDDVDVSSLNVELNSGDEFYYVVRPGSGLTIQYDSTGDSSHNAYFSSGSWRTSSLPPYHMRVVVEDDTGSRVELTSWGEVKTLD
jgi:hypothetical protein